jgi:hypothetical protein
MNITYTSLNIISQLRLCLQFAISLAFFVISQTANAQQCDFQTPTLLYTPGPDGSNPGQLFTTNPSELPTIADQVWNSPETLLRSLPQLTSGRIMATAFDRKASVLYLAVRDQSGQRPANTMIAIQSPIATSSPVVLFAETVDSSTDISSITIDYTNRNKVYFLTQDTELRNYQIRSFTRQDTPSSSPSLTAVLTILDNEEALEAIQHRRSAVANGDSLLLLTILSDSPTLKEIPLNVNGTGGTPVTIDDNLFNPLPGFADFRTLKNASFDPASLDLYLVREDSMSVFSTKVLSRYTITNTNSPTSVLLDDSLVSQASPPPTCDIIQLVAGSGSSSSDAKAFIYCTPFDSGNSGIIAFNQDLSLSNPIVSIGGALPGTNQKPGVISCCNNGADADTDGDSLKDCADSAPLVQLDTDGDGLTDFDDACPNDFASAADMQLSGLLLGCPCIDTFDSDLDGLKNCQEPANAILIPAGAECTDTADADGDGTQNCFDPCPNDPKKIIPLTCGCEIEETPTCSQFCKPGVVDLGCGCGVSDCPTPRTGTILTRLTNLDSPPDIVFGQPANDGSRSITLMFQDFVGAARVRVDSLLRALGLSAARRQRLSVAYDVVITKIEGNRKRNVLRRTVRANSLLVRKLASGLYTAKYRALIRGKNPRTGEKRTMGKTSFSPSQTFSF